MTVKITPTTRSVVDNWLLEFAGRLISPELDKMYSSADKDRRYLSSRFSSAYPFAMWYMRYPSLLLRDKLISLLHLVDLIIVNEKLIYNSGEQHHKLWFDSGVFGNIEDLLESHEFTRFSANESGVHEESTPFRYSELAGEFLNHLDLPAMVHIGAMKYLEFAASLGVNYWPSPQRSVFLRKHVFNVTSQKNCVAEHNNFRLGFQQTIDLELKNIIDQCYSSINQVAPLYFGGFSPLVLANCDSPESIISTALQVRNSKSARSFRHWLVGMNNALAQGNVRKLQSEMQSVHAVLNDIKREMGQLNDDDGSAVLELGISPTLQLTTKRLNRLLSPFKKKQLHLVFLRKTFEQKLTNANIHAQLSRLFPDYISKVDLDDRDLMSMDMFESDRELSEYALERIVKRIRS